MSSPKPRRGRARDDRLARAGGALLVCIVGLGALLAPRASKHLVLFNHSASMPIGFYARVEEPIAPTLVVTVRANAVAPEAAATAGFDGPRDRFLKRIAALEGDFVCAGAEALLINGQARARYFPSASIRPWRGCRRLHPGEALLLGESPDSFDGRYWGPIALDLIEGRWRPLWLFHQSQATDTEP